MAYDGKAVGRRIKSGIVDRGITSDQLAEEVGVSRQTVSAWMNDRASIGLADACKVCDVFGWPLDYLALRDEVSG